MSVTLGWLNLVLGIVYTSYGVLTVLDIQKHGRERGLSHFGLAWIAMAFTCGPHHLVHGIHLALEGREVGAVELAAVIIGYPAGVTWFLLRIEALAGRRGDRYIAGTPWWLRVAMVVMGTLTLGVTAAFLPVVLVGVTQSPVLIPNLLLILTYVMIGVYLGRGQLANRDGIAGWSLSGLCLTVVFPTCALMHASYALYVARGTFAPDAHGLWIDWLAVPAAVYFLWVVRSLYHGTLQDWNRSIETISDEFELTTAA